MSGNVEYATTAMFQSVFMISDSDTMFYLCFAQLLNLDEFIYRTKEYREISLIDQEIGK